MSDPILRREQELRYLRTRLQQVHSGCLVSTFYLFSLVVLLVGLALVLIACESSGSLLRRQQQNKLEVSVSAPMQGTQRRGRVIDLSIGGPSLRLRIDLQDDPAPPSSEIFEIPPTQK